MEIPSPSMPPEAKAIWLREIKPTEGAIKDFKESSELDPIETVRRVM